MTKYIDADARPTQYDRIRAMSVEEMAAWFLNEVPSVIDSPIWCKNACGEDALKDKGGYTEFSRYCPYCGAKMDGEKEGV